MDAGSNNIIKNIMWKFAERMLAQIITLVVSIVLARLLMPEDYGSISMVIVFITIANVFVVEGIPSALIQKKDADEIDFSSVFYFNIFFSVIIYGLLFCGAPYIAKFYNNEILCLIIRVLGLKLIIASINSVQHSYVSRHMMFKLYFWSTLFGTVFSGIVGIGMAYWGCGVWALVAQYLTNTVIDTCVLWKTIKWRPIRVFRFERVKQLLKFGWRMLFEGASNAIVEQVQNLVIGKTYTSTDLAFYTKGQQFPGLIVNNISVSIASVLFPAISNEQEDKKRVLIILRKSVRLSSYVVFPLLTGLAATAPAFIGLILTDKWMGAVAYLQVFCLLYAPTVGMIPRHQALNGTGRSDVYMNEHIISRIIAITLLLLMYKISIWAIVVCSITSTSILSLIIAFTSKRYNGYSYRNQIMDILPILVGCLIMGVPVYCISFAKFTNAVTLVLQVFVGSIIYIAYSKIVGLEEFDICYSYMKRIKTIISK